MSTVVIPAPEKIKVVTFNFETTTNPYVSPFGAYASIRVAQSGYTVISAIVIDSANSVPMVVNIRGEYADIYSNNAASASLVVAYKMNS